MPWAIAFKNNENVGYVVSASSNIIVKIAVDPGTGAVTVQNNPLDKRVMDIQVGRNPRGITINNADTRAYVYNAISHDVTVVDLTRTPEQVIATMRRRHSQRRVRQKNWPGQVANCITRPSVTSRTPSATCLLRMGIMRIVPPLRTLDNVVWIFGRTTPHDLAAPGLRGWCAACAELVGYLRRGTRFRG